MTRGPVGVLIVGGGPGGALAARGLALLGHSVVVVEAQAHPQPKPCGEFIAPAGVAVLARSGLLPQLGDLGLMLGQLSLVASRGALRVQLPGPALGIRREDLDRVLLEEAAAAGATVVRGQRVIGILHHAGQANPWRVQLDAGTTFEAGLLIGADGRHSRVRQWAGLGRAVGRSGRHALVVRAGGVAHGRGGEMHLGRLGQLGICPLPDAGTPGVERGRTSEVNLNLLLSPAGVQCMGRMPGDQLLRSGIAATPSLASRLREVVFVGPVLAVAHARQQAEQVTGPDLALIGDAAFSCDPFTGEGMSNALGDAEQLVAAAEACGQRPAEALACYARSHSRLHRRQRREMPALSWLLAQPRLNDALVSRLSRSRLARQAFQHRQLLPAMPNAPFPEESHA